MDFLSNRKKHEPSTNLKDVILCCRHATKTFTELNGFLHAKYVLVTYKTRLLAYIS